MQLVAKHSTALRCSFYLLAGGAIVATACSGGGQYGYARAYTPLDREETALEDSKRFDPVMARRLPQDWRTEKVNLFGVVIARRDSSDGKVDALLSVRRLAARNLCESGDNNSCRVTVGDQELARVHVLLSLEKMDSVGQGSLGPRSLIRLVGRLQDQPDRKDGTDVILANYYRHWPAANYVTEQAREYMRR